MMAATACASKRQTKSRMNQAVIYENRVINQKMGTDQDNRINNWDEFIWKCTMNGSQEIDKFETYKLPTSTTYLDRSELKRFSSAEFVVELLNKVNISDFDFFGEFLLLDEMLLLLFRVSCLRFFCTGL